jgi:hypothetical protein
MVELFLKEPAFLLAGLLFLILAVVIIKFIKTAKKTPANNTPTDEQLFNLFIDKAREGFFDPSVDNAEWTKRVSRLRQLFIEISL